MSILVAVWAVSVKGFVPFKFAAVQVVVAFPTYWTALLTLTIFAGMAKFPADLTLSGFREHFFDLHSFKAHIHVCRQGPGFEGQLHKM